jgi:hypothetical protein
LEPWRFSLFTTKLFPRRCEKLEKETIEVVEKLDSRENRSDPFIASVPDCLLTSFPEKPMSGAKITPSFSSSSLLSSEF